MGTIEPGETAQAFLTRCMEYCLQSDACAGFTDEQVCTGAQSTDRCCKLRSAPAADFYLPAESSYVKLVASAAPSAEAATYRTVSGRASTSTSTTSHAAALLAPGPAPHAERPSAMTSKAALPLAEPSQMALSSGGADAPTPEWSIGLTPFLLIILALNGAYLALGRFLWVRLVGQGSIRLRRAPRAAPKGVALEPDAGWEHTQVPRPNPKVTITRWEPLRKHTPHVAPGLPTRSPPSEPSSEVPTSPMSPRHVLVRM